MGVDCFQVTSLVCGEPAVGCFPIALELCRIKEEYSKNTRINDLWSHGCGRIATLWWYYRSNSGYTIQWNWSMQADGVSWSQRLTDCHWHWTLLIFSLHSLKNSSYWLKGDHCGDFSPHLLLCAASPFLRMFAQVARVNFWFAYSLTIITGISTKSSCCCCRSSSRICCPTSLVTASWRLHRSIFTDLGKWPELKIYFWLRSVHFAFCSNQCFFPIIDFFLWWLFQNSSPHVFLSYCAQLLGLPALSAHRLFMIFLASPATIFHQFFSTLPTQSALRPQYIQCEWTHTCREGLLPAHVTRMHGFFTINLSEKSKKIQALPFFLSKAFYLVLLFPLLMPEHVLRCRKQHCPNYAGLHCI